MIRPSLVTVLLMAPVAPAAAQIPETFTNLKVLPRDITRPQMIETMRGFAMALGVRCVHCHVGPASGDLEGADFAADDKDTKRAARAMIEMVRAINGDHLARLGTDREVSCFTCHRGASAPSRLEDELFAAWRAGGPDSLSAAYRGLRSRWYGRAAFDFGENTLIGTAGMLTRPGVGPSGLAGGVAALRLQTEFFPDHAMGWAQLAAALARSGDTTAAITAAERASALMPDNPQVRRMLESLRPPRS